MEVINIKFENKYINSMNHKSRIYIDSLNSELTLVF